MLLMENKVQSVFFMLRAFLVSSSILFFCSSANANFNNALKLYEEKNYPEAFYAFKNLAYIGDKESQFNLGVMYFRGEHVEKDAIEAYAWMHVASENDIEKFIRIKNILYKKLGEKEQHAADFHAGQYLKTFGKVALGNSLAPKPLSDADCTQDVKLLHIKQPKYPDAKESAGQIGYVDIVLNISPQGYARDISVRTITDSAFFEASAKSAISGRWEGKIEDGYLVPQLNINYRFRFAGFKDGRLRTSKFVKAAKKSLKKAEEGDVKSQYLYAKTLDAARAMKLKLKTLDIEYRNSNEWYMLSAKSGHPLAQYELGKNMLAGKGCEADRETGLKWLRAAALAGHPYAQEEIAMSTINDGVSDARRAVFWLRKASNSNAYPPKLFLAWELAANSSFELRDGNEALRLLEEEAKYYYDDVRLFETKAAAYAQLDDFSNAVKWQAMAIKKAKSLRWDIPVMQDRLAAYSQSKSWSGAYHVPQAVPLNESSS